MRAPGDDAALQRRPPSAPQRGPVTSRDAATASSNSRASSRAKAASCTITLASRLSSSDSGSMFELPTVAQSSSTTATFACRKAGVYSWMRTP